MKVRAQTDNLTDTIVDRRAARIGGRDVGTDGIPRRSFERTRNVVSTRNTLPVGPFETTHVHTLHRTHTTHSFRKRLAHAGKPKRGPTCMCVRRAPSRARPCVAPPGSACSRRLCPAVRLRDRVHAAARGNPDESVAADARREHARERCGACWSSAQRAPARAYARVT